jgi:hypothetical protein
MTAAFCCELMYSIVIAPCIGARLAFRLFTAVPFSRSAMPLITLLEAIRILFPLRGQTSPSDCSSLIASCATPTKSSCWCWCSAYSALACLDSQFLTRNYCTLYAPKITPHISCDSCSISVLLEPHITEPHESQTTHPHMS